VNGSGEEAQVASGILTGKLTFDRISNIYAELPPLNLGIHVHNSPRRGERRVSGIEEMIPERIHVIRIHQPKNYCDDMKRRVIEEDRFHLAPEVVVTRFAHLSLGAEPADAHYRRS
jgi:hypothetical protein